MGVRKAERRALWINSDFLQGVTGVQTRNTGLPCFLVFWGFFPCDFIVLKKIISCWVLPKIQAEAIKPGKGFVVTCSRMKSIVFPV